jgi:hypothetical protein
MSRILRRLSIEMSVYQPDPLFASLFEQPEPYQGSKDTGLHRVRRHKPFRRYPGVGAAHAGTSLPHTTAAFLDDCSQREARFAPRGGRRYPAVPCHAIFGQKIGKSRIRVSYFPGVNDSLSRPSPAW